MQNVLLKLGYCKKKKKKRLRFFYIANYLGVNTKYTSMYASMAAPNKFPRIDYIVVILFFYTHLNLKICVTESILFFPRISNNVKPTVNIIASTTKDLSNYIKVYSNKAIRVKALHRYSVPCPNRNLSKLYCGSLAYKMYEPSINIHTYLRSSLTTNTLLSHCSFRTISTNRTL